jgi:hypothetical protein
MAFTRDDRRIILFTGGLLVVAALFFASVLVFATGGSTPSKRHSEPLYIGQSSDLREKIDLGSPLYFPNPFGDRGFWLDRARGEFLALDVGLPGDTRCSIKWWGRDDTYKDCHRHPITTNEMASYPVEVARTGERKGGVFIDLKHRLAPGDQG